MSLRHHPARVERPERQHRQPRWINHRADRVDGVVGGLHFPPPHRHAHFQHDADVDDGALPLGGDVAGGGAPVLCLRLWRRLPPTRPRRALRFSLRSPASLSRRSLRPPCFQLDEERPDAAPHLRAPPCGAWRRRSPSSSSARFRRRTPASRRSPAAGPRPPGDRAPPTRPRAPRRRGRRAGPLAAAPPPGRRRRRHGPGTRSSGPRTSSSRAAGAARCRA